jgi:hypothetical protein
MPTPKKPDFKPVTIDFRHAIRRKPGESVIDASRRAKRLSLERLAQERLSELVNEFLKVFRAFESELPKGEAARTLELFVAKQSKSHLFLLLDAKVPKDGSGDEVLKRLREAVAR